MLYKPFRDYMVFILSAGMNKHTQMLTGKVRQLAVLLMCSEKTFRIQVRCIHCVLSLLDYNCVKICYLNRELNCMVMMMMIAERSLYGVETDYAEFHVNGNVG